MYRMIIAVTVHNSKNVYATQMPADKYDGLKKTQCIYTVKYYTAVKYIATSNIVHKF